MKTVTEVNNFQSLVEFSAQFLAQVRITFRLKALEPMKHTLDAFLTWMIGVVSGVQDVTATLDMAHCRLPDFYMQVTFFAYFIFMHVLQTYPVDIYTYQDVFKCACNDAAYKIPDERATETFRQGAFWCSGTLNMLGVDQNPLVIFNPFSYKELQNGLINLDKYLECKSTIGMGEAENNMGQTCESLRPSIKELEDQGVSSIAVLTRCKSNYAASQWDEGASVLFQPDAVFKRLTMGKADLAGVADYRYEVTESFSTIITKELKDCLLTTAANGQPPDACLLDIFLRTRKKEDFFVYETLSSSSSSSSGTSSSPSGTSSGTSSSPSGTSSGTSSSPSGPLGRESMLIDACEVYTGPASENRSQEFKHCLDNDLETQCNIPSFIWSGRSTGRTPVANFHSWKDTESVGLGQTVWESPKMRRAVTEFQGIAKKMSAIIQAVNQTFAKEGITAELFSAEGDALHQVMDCIFMGPYARMDFGSRGTRGNLPIPSWSRRNFEVESDTRVLPLPCTGESMQGDFKVPFTCGSQTRRSIIKYFVRNFAVPASGSCGSAEVNATVQVRQKL